MVISLIDGILKKINIEFLSKFFRKLYLRKLMDSMRGYRVLKRTNRLPFLHSLRIQIDARKLTGISGKLNKSVFFASDYEPEVSIRQYLLVRLLLYKYVNLSLLSYFGKPKSKILLPFPKEWRDLVREQGVSIHEGLSKFFWGLEVALLWMKGIYEILSFTLNTLKSGFKPMESNDGATVFFEGISSKCLPRVGKDGKSYDIISWYLQWENKNPNIRTIYHNVKGISDFEYQNIKVLYRKNLIAFGNSILISIRLWLWFCKVFLSNLIDLVLGRWWNLILIGEAFYAYYLRIQKHSVLCDDYMFQSDWTYRPLWTYEAEKKACRVLFYFYSTNSEGIRTESGYKPVDYDWRSLTWSHYLVWDTHQAEFMRQVIPEWQKTEIVGPIWLQNSDKEVPKISGKTISVFDVQPMRYSIYHMLGAPYEYFIPDNAIRFVEDICKIGKDLGFKIIWKRKREVGNHIHPRFENFLKRNERQENVILLDPEVAAIRLIQETDICISMPFTSTALIGKHLNKPSCYYDASGLVTEGDKGAHGVEIVSGPDELRKWLLNQKRP